MIVEGQIVDIPSRTIFPGAITIADGIIKSIDRVASAPEVYILPGFIDAHIHIESSMMAPSEFARMAVVHGTVATVSDPHEIANALGISGVQYMIDNARQTPMKFYFGAPSCVPATTFESAGASLPAADVEKLLQSDDILYLAEMMNWPGVLGGDPEVLEKIAIAKKYNKPIDGHAPGLRGAQASAYVAAGMSTDHECFTREEALDKLQAGMNIIIREGSAAKNFDALAPLLHDHYEMMMFCSDDKHPDSLEEGHINELVERAVANGIDVFKVLSAACINPIKHYKLKVGQLRVKDPADFVMVNNLKHFKVTKTFINGDLVAEDGRTFIPRVAPQLINNFDVPEVKPEDFRVSPRSDGKIRVIEAFDGQLITKSLVAKPLASKGNLISDPSRDLLKIVVVNRYEQKPVAVSFIKNFDLKTGAIASSVAHDSHNIISVGVTDELISEAVNLIIKEKGGISAVDGNGSRKVLPLPVAGIMSADDCFEIARAYKEIDLFAKSMGSTLAAPFMTLSFMALLVIPELKLSDKGLFDGKKFTFVDSQF